LEQTVRFLPIKVVLLNGCSKLSFDTRIESVIKFPSKISDRR